MSKKFYTYVWRNEYTNIPFYVGKGKEKRAWDMTNRSKQLLGHIRNLNEAGLNFIIDIYPASNEEEAFNKETQLIKQYGRLDLNTGTLFNFTDGGEGVSGYIHTDELRKLWSIQRSGENNPRFGDHRNWIELHGDKKTSKLKEDMSTRNIGTNNPMYGKSREDLRIRNLTDNPAKKESSRKKISEFAKSRVGLNSPLYGKPKSLKSIEKMQDTKSLNWEIISPTNEKFIIKNLRKYCRDHNLNHGNLQSKGKYKGWKCRKLDNE